MRMLFECLRRDADSGVDVTLFKGDGERRDQEVVLRTPRRHGWLCETLSKFRGDHLYWEYLFFCLAFLARCFLTRDRYSSIACIEPMASKTIRRLCFLLPGRPRITFTHGVWMDPPGYHRNGDCIHEVNIENYERMRAHIAETQATTELVCIPHFLPADDGSRGQTAPTRASFGISTRFVVLAVGVIDSDHKRTDHVIREVARLGPDWTLLACGTPKGGDGQRVAALGRELLGQRFVNISLPREDVWKAYSVADFFVLGSLNEGFGLVLLEAMRAGLPVIAHDRPLFRWILGSAGIHARMDAPGDLAACLGELSTSTARMRELRTLSELEFQSRFTWPKVRDQYLGMINGATAPYTASVPVRD